MKKMLKVNNIKNLVIFSIIILFFIFSTPILSIAQNVSPGSDAYGPRIDNPTVSAMPSYTPSLDGAFNVVSGTNVTKSSSPGLVTCNGTTIPCTFSKLVEMINKIINWIISLAIVIFTISAIYGGFLYMMSGDNPGNKTKARGILWNTLLGFIIILTAWLIVFTILKTLTPDRPYIFKFIGTGN